MFILDVFFEKHPNISAVENSLKVVYILINGCSIDTKADLFFIGNIYFLISSAFFNSATVLLNSSMNWDWYFA